MGGLLLVVLALIEAVLFMRRKPLLSNQRGWKQALVVAAWAILGIHLWLEDKKRRAAELVAKNWRW